MTSDVRKPRKAISALAACPPHSSCVWSGARAGMRRHHESFINPSRLSSRPASCSPKAVIDESAKALASVGDAERTGPFSGWVVQSSSFMTTGQQFQTLERGVALVPDDAEMHRWLGRAATARRRIAKTASRWPFKCGGEFEEAVRRRSDEFRVRAAIFSSSISKRLALSAVATTRPDGK